MSDDNDDVLAKLRAQMAAREEASTDEEIASDEKNQKKCAARLEKYMANTPCFACEGPIDGLYRRSDAVAKDMSADTGSWSVSFFVSVMKKLTPSCAGCASILKPDGLYGLNYKVSKLEKAMLTEARQRYPRKKVIAVMSADHQRLQRLLREEARMYPDVARKLGSKLALPVDWS